MCRRSRLVKPAGRSASAQQAARSAWTRGSGKRMPGTRVQVVLMTGLVRVSRAAVAGGGVVADAFGVQEAPVGGVAGLRHGGEVSQLFADAEVARLVEGGLGAERSSFLQVLLDLGLLVEQVEVGAGAAGDDLGPEGPGGPVLAALPDGAAEDEVHLVRAADVEVVADQLLEEDPAVQRPVQGHRGGELDLLDRQLPAVIGVFILAGERLRQPGEPLAGEPVDLLVGQPVADPLDRAGVAGRAERVVQRR